MIKSVIMPGNKQAIVVYRLPDGRVYCSDANSTAFEFPLSNAKVIAEGAFLTGGRLTETRQRQGMHMKLACCACPAGGGPKVEVPLDGTVYDLETGNVSSHTRYCLHIHRLCA